MRRATRLLTLTLGALMAAPAWAQDLTKLPELVTPAEPAYPPAALEAEVAAHVVLELDIDAAGRVETATVVETVTATRGAARPDRAPLRRAFEASALEASARLEFSPAEVDGAPVPIRLRYTFAFEPPPPPPAPPPVATATVAAPPGVERLVGVVREKGSRRRLEGAVVLVGRGEDAFEAVTDAQGSFRFFDLASGGWSVAVEAAGYESLRATETLRADDVVEVTYYLHRAADNPYDVLVEVPGPQREVTRRALSTKAAAKVAGTLGDTVLAIENLPGVARGGDGNGRPIRGSSPQDTRFYLEGLDVLFTEHVGGFRSVLPSQMVERVDFYPGNFSARYGRGTGGVIDVKLRSLDPDQLHGALDISLLDAGLYLEAPITDTLSVAVAGRRSYIDAILGAVVPDDEDVSLSTAPRWYDYQLDLQYKPSKHHEVRIFGVGANDALEIRLANAAEADFAATNDTFSFNFDYQRVSLQYRYDSGTDVSNDLRIGLGRDAGLSNALGRSQVGFRFLNVNLRNEARWRVLERLTLFGGVDARVESSSYDVTSFRPPKEGQVFVGLPDEDETVVAVGNLSYANVAGFVEAEWRPVEAVTVLPGLRIDYFGATETVTFDPRLTLRYQPWSQWTFTAGVGLVHQAPELDELVVPFGNPAVEPSRALHVSAGARWRPLESLSADVTFFYKHLDNLVSRIEGPELYDNGGTGEVLGMEVFLRKRLSHHLSGWLSYTLSRARRTDSGAQAARLFDFDQTHILALVARYELPRGWGLGVRWRFVSGRPTTPLTGGVFVNGRDAYEPNLGAVNSDRLPAFHMLDLRIDKTWVFDAWTLSTYLSVSNAYNRANAESLSYSFDYRQSEPVSGLPVLPILGLTGDF